MLEAPIYSRGNGYLKRWLVDIGAHVEAGQLLAEVDTPELDQQLEQARAQLAESGAFGGWWQADPKEKSVFVFLAHNMVDLAQMAQGIGLGVWATIDQLLMVASES